MSTSDVSPSLPPHRRTSRSSLTTDVLFRWGLSPRSDARKAFIHAGFKTNFFIWQKIARKSNYKTYPQKTLGNSF